MRIQFKADRNRRLWLRYRPATGRGFWLWIVLDPFTPLLRYFFDFGGRWALAMRIDRTLRAKASNQGEAPT